MERAFPNRAEAGRLLAEKLEKYADRDDVIVLGLPRGGVPVAYEVAKSLRVPLDVFIVRKLGVPGFEELAANSRTKRMRPSARVHLNFFRRLVNITKTSRKRATKKCAICWPALRKIDNERRRDCPRDRATAYRQPERLRGVVGTDWRRADCAVGRSISRHARILLRARSNHETAYR